MDHPVAEVRWVDPRFHDGDATRAQVIRQIPEDRTNLALCPDMSDGSEEAGYRIEPAGKVEATCVAPVQGNAGETATGNAQHRRAEVDSRHGMA
jgi:hypothetical protein